MEGLVEEVAKGIMRGVGYVLVNFFLTLFSIILAGQFAKFLHLERTQKK